MKARIEIIGDDGSVYVGEAALYRREGKVPRPKSVSTQGQSKAVRCPEALKLLWAKGTFKSRLSLSEVKAVLQENGGYDFPDNTLFMALSGAPFLTQKGTKGSYTWGQKYPYS